MLIEEIFIKWISAENELNNMQVWELKNLVALPINVQELSLCSL